MTKLKKHPGKPPCADQKGDPYSEQPTAPKLKTEGQQGNSVETAQKIQKKEAIIRKFLRYLLYPGKLLKKISASTWTAIFTAMLTLFTFLLYSVANQTNETTRATQRAFLSFQGLKFGSKVVDPATKKAVQLELFGVWENSGTTPTKEALTHTSFKFQTDQLPKGFDFPDLGESDNRPFIIGPKGTIRTVVFAMPIEAFSLVQQGKVRLYVWGWVTYRDIFPNTPEHVTEFCWEVTNMGSNIADLTDPAASLIITPVICQEHNCYDDECKRKAN